MKGSSRKLVIGFSLLLAGIIGGGIGYYQYNKPHKDLSKEKPDIVITAVELVDAFSSDEAAANQLYLGKIVEVSGVISGIQIGEEDSHISISSDDPMAEIIAEFQSGESLKALQEGQSITIRGTCSGSLGDVILNRCVIIP